MKPMHAKIKRLGSRGGCPCCRGITCYSANGAYRKNDGKSAARQAHKRDIKKEISGRE